MYWIWQDLRYGWRGISKQPAFTALAVIALALGIGAVTAIFTVVDNVLFDPFPYKNTQRVVLITIHDVKEGGMGRGWFSIPEFLDYQEQNRVFEEVIGTGYEDVLYASGEGTEHLNGAYVTPNLFRFLGVPALLGRGIVPEDGKAGAAPVFVMSYKMWRKRYNLDPTMVGRTLVLNGTPRTVVGIMPPRFAHRDADLWMPAVLDRSDPEGQQRRFMFQARLKPGITVQQAEADIEVIAHRLASVYRKDYPKKFTVQIVSWVDYLVRDFRLTLYTLTGVVGLLLLIACSNVANMLLARATAREKEMAIRASLGASRWRLIRQLLIESLLLAMFGATAGCVFAYAGIRALVLVIPEGAIPSESVIQLNLTALLFTLGAAAVTAVLFGLAPALQTAKRQLVEPLRDAHKGVSGGFRNGKLRNALVVLEVALSLTLLVGAGLLMRTFIRLQQVDLGVNLEKVLVGFMPLPKEQYKTAEAKQHFFRRVLARLYAMPGIVAAAETTTVPPYGGIGSEVEISGKTHTEKWDVVFSLCSEGYFRTLGIRLLRGRELSDVDINDARKVAVVNHALVKKFFGEEDPIGRRIKVNVLETEADPPVKDPVFEIVGVMADSKNRGIQEATMAEVFVPYTVTGDFERGILVRTAGEPLGMLTAVQRAIWAVDRNVPLTYTGSLEGYLKSGTYAGPRFSLILLSVFAGVGMVLVAIGTYGVLAYTVSRQTQEIGIRMALGAGGLDVLRMVMWMGARLIGLGVASGLVASVIVNRLIASQIWGVSPYDPVTFCGVVAVVTTVGLAACYFPSRRATRLDPMVALRYE
jgi:predicted permease